MSTARLAATSGQENKDPRARRGDILTVLSLLGIAALALWLRWDRLDYTEYTRDQAWVLNRTYDWLAKGDFPLVGIQSSVGTAQGAIEIYLLAIPVALSKDPRVAAAFVGLLQALAILGTYLFCSAYFGRTVGLVAALLYAVNPWALQYARKVWTPNMAPLFTILFFSSLYAAVVRRRRYQMALACLWSVVLVLIHPSAVYCGALVAVVAVLFWRRLGWRPFLVGTVLSGIVCAPYLWYEYQESFRSLRLLIGLTGGQSRFDLDAVKNVVTMASAQAFPTMMGYGFTGDWVLPDMTAQNLIATWLLYFGLAWCLWELVAPLLRRARPTGRWESHLLLLLWFAFPILVALRHPLDFYPHYFINVLPIQYVLIALGLARTVGAATNAVRSTRFAALGALAVGLVALFVAASYTVYFQRYVDYIQQQEPLGRYGIPYLYSQRAVDTARQIRAEWGVQDLYAYTSAQWDAIRYLGRPDLEIREVDTREGLALPRDPRRPAVFLLAEDSIITTDQKPFTPKEDTRTLGRLRALGYVELGDKAVRGPLGYTYYRFFYLAPEAHQRARVALEGGYGLSLDNGLRLRGFTLATKEATAGQTVDLSVLWDAPAGSGTNRPPEYNLYLTLLDPSGRQVKTYDWPLAQYQDRHGRDYLPHWLADDLPVAYYELAIPTDLAVGSYRVALGAYRRGDRAEVRWLDANGKDLGPTIGAGTIMLR